MRYQIDFYHQLTDLLDAIPTKPQSFPNQCQHPLITNLLKHYRLDFANEQINYELWQSQLEGYRIVEQRWRPQHWSGDSLVVVHGYFDHFSLYGRFIRWAIDLGYQVHGFDLPGHGLSSGELAAIDSFDRYSCVLRDIVNREAYPKYHLIGHSTGAAVIMNHLLDQPLNANHTPDHVILMAPLIRSQYWQGLRWLYWALKRFIHSIKRNFIPSSHCKEFFELQRKHDPLQARRIPLKWLGAMDIWIEKVKRLQPLNDLSPLIVQGTQDTTVDWRYNLPQIYRLFPKAQTQFIEGGWHNLIQETDPYWQLAKQAIEDHISV